MITNLSKNLQVIDIHTMVKRSRCVRVEIHGTKKLPLNPLTEVEKDFLRTYSLKHCTWKYRKKFAKFLNEEETLEDLDSEAFIGFEEMLVKFDKSKMTGTCLKSAFEGTWCEILRLHVKKSVDKTLALR